MKSVASQLGQGGDQPGGVVPVTAQFPEHQLGLLAVQAHWQLAHDCGQRAVPGLWLDRRVPIGVKIDIIHSFLTETL